jgi:hypothetical protein
VRCLIGVGAALSPLLRKIKMSKRASIVGDSYFILCFLQWNVTFLKQIK